MSETTDLLSGMPLTTTNDMNFETKDQNMTLITTTKSLMDLLVSYPWDWEWTGGVNTSQEARKIRRKVEDIFRVRLGLDRKLGFVMMRELEHRYGPYGTVNTYPREEYKTDLRGQITDYLTTHYPTEEKTMTETPTTPEDAIAIAQENFRQDLEKRLANPLRKAIQWVGSRLDEIAYEEFVRLATEIHPITGRSRQDAMRITGVGDKALREQVKVVARHTFKRNMLLGNQWHEFRLGEETMKLGTDKFDNEAKAWFNDSRRFMDIIKDVAWDKTNRKVYTVRTGYLWVSKR